MSYLFDVVLLGISQVYSVRRFYDVGRRVEYLVLLGVPVLVWRGRNVYEFLAILPMVTAFLRLSCRHIYWARANGLLDAPNR